MNDAVTVCVFQGTTDLNGNMRKSTYFDWPVFVDECFQAASFQKVHYNTWLIFGTNRVVVNGDDVWMTESTEAGNLALKALTMNSILFELHLHHLDCNIAIESKLLGFVDNADATSAQDFFDEITTLKRCTN